MVKLPMSEYVANYYKEQGIEFTLRQQATLCWNGYHLLKDQLKSLREILEMSDDEKLNTEIRERIEYEEKSYECFLANRPGCIYVFIPDPDDEDESEYYRQYFSSVEAAVSYGITHCKDTYQIEKHYLFEKYPKGFLDKEDDKDNYITKIAYYYYTSRGDVTHGWTDECHPSNPSVEGFDRGRFEDMFLNIKSPFGVGDIVIGEGLEYPYVVASDHDCFEKEYSRHQDPLMIDITDNLIFVDCISPSSGEPDYTDIYPFDLWKVDSWEDQDYWEIVQMVSKMVKADVIPYSLNYLIQEYMKGHKGGQNGKSKPNPNRIM